MGVQRLQPAAAVIRMAQLDHVAVTVGIPLGAAAIPAVCGFHRTVCRGIHRRADAVRLGGYQSVARPAAEKTQPVQMQTVTVGPISNGDAARLYALCGDLGLVESGLYHAAYTEV